MLKKLVKYGNSNALVLDKALLELLNITEGSIVKIKTDGTSLIITPHNKMMEETIVQTITPEEKLQEAVQHISSSHCKNPEEGKAYTDELNKVFAKYASSIKKFDMPDAQKAIKELEQRFNGNKYDPEYIKEMAELRQKLVPELVHMDQEAQALSQKYAVADYQYADQENKGKLTTAALNFRKVHEKYRHIHSQVTQLFENPDFINESVILAEKYHATKNSPEYIKEYNTLITKYIPEYATYQNELNEVAESFK